MTTLPSKLGPQTTMRQAGASGVALAPVPAASRPTRYALAGVGVGCVGLAGVGVVLPGMPTTIFLIVATWCFARSCPWLTDRLIRNRFFGPFLRYLEPGVRMPRRAKVIACGMMWTAIALSCLLLAWRGTHELVLVTIAVSGLIGTWAIARQGCSRN